MQIYPARLERDTNETILITFPDVPEAVSFGEDAQDALRRGVDALIAVFDAKIDDRQDIPRPSKPRRGQPTAVLPSLAATKIWLYQSMRDAGWRKADLARRLGWNPRQVDRLFDLAHASRHDQLDQAFAALGKELHISVTDAA